MTAKAIPQSTDPTVRYLSTSQAYDLWAAVYDTDGNFLQALDTIEMKTLIPRLLSLLEASCLSRPWKLVDLGCGTGRNTAALLEVDGATVVGLDVSPEDSAAKGKLSLGVFDMIEQDSASEMALDADAIVSTLVLEHIPVEVFFKHVAKMLKPGGYLLLTNMHSEMGGISQAGFVDPDTGEKIRPTSYAHTVAEVEAEAAKNGFETVGGNMKERSVDQSLVPRLGERSAKWLGVKVWFGGIFCKKS
ncbi:hypothetical protein LTS17_008456 [Exophiala oligosperma]